MGSDYINTRVTRATEDSHIICILRALLLAPKLSSSFQNSLHLSKTLFIFPKLSSSFQNSLHLSKTLFIFPSHSPFLAPCLIVNVRSLQKRARATGGDNADSVPCQGGRVVRVSWVACVDEFVNSLWGRVSEGQLVDLSVHVSIRTAVD
jgi:hypothetical protein